MGPLLWHFENSPTLSDRGEGSIELSLDEVKELARKVGFELSVSLTTKIERCARLTDRRRDWSRVVIRVYRIVCFGMSIK